jgi:hypothetical protein
MSPFPHNKKHAYAILPRLSSVGFLNGRFNKGNREIIINSAGELLNALYDIYIQVIFEPTTS